ncbi:AMP-binding protein, partial [Acinetobacter baumannii]
AVWRAGGFYVPLDPDYPRGRLVACARDAACRMVLTSAAHAALWQAEGFVTLVLSEDGIAEGAEDPASAPPPAPPSPAPLP